MKTENDELRRLDAWIAEHLFGWERIELFELILNPEYFIGKSKSMYRQDGKADYLVRPGRKAIGGDVMAREQIGSLVIGGDINLPHYTTNDADALAVLRRCAEKLDCEDMRIGCCCGIWSIQTVYRECPEAEGRIAVWKLPPDEQSLPLAICRFARSLYSASEKGEG